MKLPLLLISLLKTLMIAPLNWGGVTSSMPLVAVTLMPSPQLLSMLVLSKVRTASEESLSEALGFTLTNTPSPSLRRISAFRTLTPTKLSPSTETLMPCSWGRGLAASFWKVTVSKVRPGVFPTRLPILDVLSATIRRPLREPAVPSRPLLSTCPFKKDDPMMSELFRPRLMPFRPEPWMEKSSTMN